MPKEPTNEYELREEETAFLQLLNGEAMNAKARAFTLHNQQEAAKDEVIATEARFNAALRLLGFTHGMPDARVNPELTKLTRIDPNGLPNTH